jgi:Zn-dependent membrane protease YugP
MYLILILIVPTFLLGLYARARIAGAYKKNSRIQSRGRITGAEAARAVMDHAAIDDVEIITTRGHLTDHYDPVRKRLVLSEENFNGTSLAALGVACHEAGHAIQHKVGYAALKARMTLVPVTQIASQILPIAMFSGLFFGGTGRVMIILGIACYLVLTLFQLVTLPVEFDASRRAKQQLAGLGIVEPDEMPGVSETLNAAAFTYVAAFITAVMNLVYLIALRGRH